MEAILGILAPVLEMLAGKYGFMAQVVAVVGSLRLIFKPLMALLQSIVGVTPSVKDDELLAKVLAHPAYKAVAFLVDMVASVKLPKA